MQQQQQSTGQDEQVADVVYCIQDTRATLVLDRTAPAMRPPSKLRQQLGDDDALAGRDGDASVMDDGAYHDRYATIVYDDDDDDDADSSLRDAPAVAVGDGHGGGVEYVLGEEIEEYAHAFQAGRGGELFGESGLLAKYYSVGSDRIAALVQHGGGGGGGGADEGEVEAWQLECRTWDLVQRLFLERTRDAPSRAEIDTATVSNHALEQLLHELDADAAESRIVLDWLRDGAAAEPLQEKRGNRWLYTKETIKAARRMDAKAAARAGNVVSEVDPDAPTRQRKRLDDRDLEYERTMLRALFKHVRAGEFAEAAELCRQSGDLWRVASMQGLVEHSDPRLDGTLALGEEAVVEGNPRKALWRRMCYAIAKEPSIDPYERAFYGALCGDVASVQPVCDSWDDHLWAHYNALSQRRLESFLRDYGRVADFGNFPAPALEGPTVAEVLDGLLHAEDAELSHEARQPMRIIQARLITGQLDALIVDMHNQLLAVQNGGEATIATRPAVLRLVTHLILALRQMQFQLPAEASNTVIRAYIDLLVSAGYGGAVAIYAAELPADLAVESMSHFLATVEPIDQRKAYLRHARDNGLDVKTIILRTVETIFEEVLENIPEAFESLATVKTPLTEEELRAVGAMSWLTLGDNLTAETLTLGNALFRRLLLAGRVNAAKQLEAAMPDSRLVPASWTAEEVDESATDVGEQMRDAIEYVGHCTLARALAKYEDWKSLVRARPAEVNGRRDPVGLRQWKADLATARRECTAGLREILESDWCDRDRLERSAHDPVAADLDRLRTAYIPECVLKLHGVCAAQEGRDIEAAMTLAVLVADRLTEPMQRSDKMRVYVKELGLIGHYLC